MTKKEAALCLLGLALDVNRANEWKHEDADVWVLRILWTAEGLDPRIIHHPKYLNTLSGSDSRMTKLRRLIEHPNTPSPEREAAVAALDRIRKAGQ